MFLNMVVRHWAHLRKLALNVEDFYVKTIGWGLKNMFFDHETRNSGLFPCYRMKINDLLSSYNSTFSHPCSKFRAAAKARLAHYDSFRGGGSHIQQFAQLGLRLWVRILGVPHHQWLCQTQQPQSLCCPSLCNVSTQTQEEQMLKRPIFAILTGILYSHFPKIINHHDYLSCFMQLYSRMTAQVQTFP